MPPRPPTQSYQQILASSPLASLDQLRTAFESPADQAGLEALARVIDESIAANRSAEEAWRSLAGVRDTVLRLLAIALGRSAL